MKPENKELLLKYLCMALPYGVCAKLPNHHLVEHVYKIEKINMRNGWTEGILDCAGKQRIYSAKIEDIKLYLRPMSSMTEEEKKEFSCLTSEFEYDSYWHPDKYAVYAKIDMIGDVTDFLLAHHLDFMGLIPKGRAISIENYEILRK